MSLNFQNNMFASEKRVYALYRVSTLGQVEKDDIPMQKQRCREFADEKGWKILREFSEKGVSGFKISAKDRDAIQEIQRDAADHKFDILLVFMFDRLGRRDDETPFIVEWFVKNGIEVWSTVEGQQRFDSHVDKLMNYIRYWQASGESVKTSIRTKTRIGQLTEGGFYTGGVAPYGYKLVKNGRMNKRNQEVYDLVVDEEEAEIVRLIYQKYVMEGYGSQRLCRYLADMGVVRKNGHNLPTTSINRILKNIVYTGIIKNGDTQSAQLEDLRIIDDNLYERAQIIMKERTMPHGDAPKCTKGQALLVGKVFCGECGNRLSYTTSGHKQKLPDGTLINITRGRYCCLHQTRHPGACTGQTAYASNTLDPIVDQAVRNMLKEIKVSSETELIQSEQKREVEEQKKKVKSAEKELTAAEKELQDYRNETIKVIRGESKLDTGLLNSLIGECEVKIQLLEKNLEVEKSTYEKMLASADNLKKEYRQLIDWAEMYDNCTTEAKRMIIGQLVKGVYVTRGYKIQVSFNVSFVSFQGFKKCQNSEKTA